MGPEARGQPVAPPHTLGTMTADPAGAARESEAHGVLMAEAVLQRMRRVLPNDQAASGAQAILEIPSTQAVPIRLEVPGDPPGTQYWALTPGLRTAPVVIYRKKLRAENGEWLVTTLMDRDAYREYSGGLADNSVVQGVASIVAAGRIGGIWRPVQSAG